MICIQPLQLALRELFLRLNLAFHIRPYSYFRILVTDAVLLKFGF